MPLFSSKLALRVGMPVAAILLFSACTSVYDMPMNISRCPSEPNTINKSFAQKYGHKDVLRKVFEADNYTKQNKLQNALSTISEGLALPNVNAYGRSVLYRSKGQAYFNSGNNNEGIKAFEAAVAQGSLDIGEAGFMRELIDNAKAHGNLKAGDIDAQPLVRIPPMFPPNISESGHCRAKFDVTVRGVPVNVKTTYCTNPLLKKVTVNSIKQWKYTPKILDGTAVARKGVLSKVTFKLTDECGVLIPEPN